MAGKTGGTTMYATTRKPNRQDRLVNDTTAFFTWSAMLTCLRKGYVPTIRRTRQGDKLARLVESAGFRTFRIQ
jgi:hypothetical protein